MASMNAVRIVHQCSVGVGHKSSGARYRVPSFGMRVQSAWYARTSSVVFVVDCAMTFHESSVVLHHTSASGSMLHGLVNLA